eukprot:PhF_6_TR39536/c0_g2_i1/m.58636
MESLRLSPFHAAVLSNLESDLLGPIDVGSTTTTDTTMIQRSVLTEVLTTMKKELLYLCPPPTASTTIHASVKRSRDEMDDNGEHGKIAASLGPQLTRVGFMEEEGHMIPESCLGTSNWSIIEGRAEGLTDWEDKLHQTVLNTSSSSKASLLLGAPLSGGYVITKYVTAGGSDSGGAVEFETYSQSIVLNAAQVSSYK